MKRLALLLAVAALGVTGLSYYGGFRIERDFQTGMRRLTERPDFPGEISTTYKRGVFSSTAESQVRWAAGSAPIVTMQHRVAHGPIPWAGLRHGARPGDTWIESQLSFGTGGNPALAAVFADVPALQILTTANATGGSSVFRWPAFEGSSPESGRLSIAELRGEIDFGGPREEAVGFLEWDGMKMESPFFSFEVAKMRGEFAYENIFQAAIYGQSAFMLEAVTALTGGQAVADLRNLSWAEQRAVDDGKMFLHSTLGVESLTVMGFELRDGSLDSRFENLDLSVWEKVRQIGKSLAQASQATTLATAGATGPSMPNEAEALALLQSFVAADPSFSMTLDARVNGEMLSANTYARFEDGAGVSGLDPAALMRALDAELEVKIPAALLDAWIDGPRGASGKGAQLRVLRDQGLLRRAPGNRYETQLEFRGGEIFVNGIPYEAFRKLGPGSGRAH